MEINKILLSTDWHIGIKGDSDLYHQIFLKWINTFLIKNINENNIKYLCVAGDIFNNRNTINVKSLNIVTQGFEELLSSCLNLKEIWLIMGNHDIYNKNTREIHSLKALEKLSPKIKIINEITRITIDNKKIVLCPWLIHETEHNLLFSEKADICVGHFEINGFELVNGIKEDKGLVPSKFKETFNKTFSGHYHLNSAENYSKNENQIFYIGTPYQLNWGDYDNKKGCYVLNINTLEHTFIENIISPTYEKIYISRLKKNINQLENIENKFIHLIIDDETTDEKTINKIQEIVTSKNPLSFTIDNISESIIENTEINDTLSTPLEYLYEYIKANEIISPTEYDKNELIKIIQNIIYKLNK